MDPLLFYLVGIVAAGFVGFSLAALFSTRAYDRGFADGARFWLRERQRPQAHRVDQDAA